MMMHKLLNVWKNVKTYRFKSIFIQYFFIIFIVIVIPLLCTEVLISINNNKVAENEKTNMTMNSIYKSKYIADAMLKEIDNLLYYFSQDNEVKQFVGKNNSRYPDFSSIEQMQSIINKISLAKSDFLSSIYVYSKNNSFVMSSEHFGQPLSDMKDKTWAQFYDEISTHFDTVCFLRKVNDSITSDEMQWLISFGRTVRTQSGNPNGIVIANIGRDKFDGAFQEIYNQNKNRMLIADWENKVIYDSTGTLDNKSLEELISPKNIKNKNGMVVCRLKSKEQVTLYWVSSSVMNWKYITIIPYKYMEIQKYLLNKFIIISTLLSILFSALISFIISKRIYYPIEEIISVVNDPDIKLGIEKNQNEVKYIISNILNTYDEQSRIKDDMHKQMTMINKSRAAALQSQITPHFLYNSLQAINWLIIFENNNEESSASQALMNLSELIHAGIDNQENFFNISEEMEYIKRYMDIQKIRYGDDKLDFVMEIPDNIKQYLIPKFILQPLVENAIYHGIKQKNEKGLIRVSGEENNENLLIFVMDDGIGMCKKEIEQYNNQFKEQFTPTNEHVGLINVNGRLKLMFGKEYGLNITQMDSCGTLVKVTIPKVKNSISL